MSHEIAECKHAWSAWTTEPPWPDPEGVVVQRLMRKCYTCNLEEWEYEEPKDA